MTTEERLEKLEQELADLRAELATCVETREIRVVDEKGEIRATLAVSEDGPALVLLDENGRNRAVMYVAALPHAEKDVRAGLSLIDQKGKNRWHKQVR